MTPEQIQKIAENWAQHCRGLCSMAGEDVPNLSRLAETIKGAIAEAITPAWTKELPSDPGFYFWTDGKCTPELLHCDLNSYGEMCVVNCGRVARGYWIRITPPQPPKETHKCTPITEYATRTTPVKIKCIECGREL